MNPITKFCLLFLSALILVLPAHAIENNYKGELNFIADGQNYRITDLPAFKDYPAESAAKQLASDIDWASEKDAWRFRTRLRAGLKNGANFNGHYAVITHGCGTSCQLNWIVDVENGQVIGTITTSLGAQYRLDSGLIAADLADNSTMEELDAASPHLNAIRFYTIEDGKLILIKSLNVYDEIKKLSTVKLKQDHAFWEEISKRPDVKISTENGRKTAHFSSGVSMTSKHKGVDRSGKGAVLCGWEMYVALRNMVEICSPSEESEIMKNLNYAIEKTNDFIVANSLHPVTKADLEKGIKARLIVLKEDMSMLEEYDIRQECSSGHAAQAKKRLISLSSEEFRKSVDDFLSIPRPPVMEPCL